ncbi:replication initiator protein A [Butyrivibrio sp.]|uniref:replication initiator protein A n=1 Tax=Butyrivibrio sp. TaxID=28121 RepID=UPI0025BEB939|nr:replication initiator protein A [Butyrivibrio sp.]MBE5838454.1 hypothetical protein [Butyrivibrio sp.]
MKFEYFNGREPISNSYMALPKCFHSDPVLNKVSVNARYLYALLLDRMKLSAINNMVDKEGKTYVFYDWEDVHEATGLSKNTVYKLFEELDSEKGIGLIERVKMGQGKPSRIYVMRIVEAEQNVDTNAPENHNSEKVQKLTICDSSKKEDVSEYQKLNHQGQNWDSEVTDLGSPEYQELGRNKNNINKNNYNNNLIRIYPSNNIAPKMDGMRSDVEETAARAYVREEIGTDVLCERFPEDEGIIRGIEDLLVDVLTSNRSKIWIGSEEREINSVKGRFMKLDNMLIEDVVASWKNLTEVPKNPRAYLLTMLYNVSITHVAQITAEVNHGMRYGFGVTENQELMEG